MNSINEQFIIPFLRFGKQETEYVEWLKENEISHECIKTTRQAVGFPQGWRCDGWLLKFKRIEDVVAFKLRWL